MSANAKTIALDRLHKVSRLDQAATITHDAETLTGDTANLYWTEDEKHLRLIELRGHASVTPGRRRRRQQPARHARRRHRSDVPSRRPDAAPRVHRRTDDDRVAHAHRRHRPAIGRRLEGRSRGGARRQHRDEPHAHRSRCASSSRRPSTTPRASSRRRRSSRRATRRKASSRRASTAASTSSKRYRARKARRTPCERGSRASSSSASTASSTRSTAPTFTRERELHGRRRAR